MVLGEEGLDVAEVDRVGPEPVSLVSHDQGESSGQDVGMEPFHSRPVQVLARPPGFYVVGDGPNRHLLVSPLLDVTVGYALLSLKRYSLSSLLLRRDAGVNTDPQWMCLGTLDHSFLQFHCSCPSS